MSTQTPAFRLPTRTIIGPGSIDSLMVEVRAIRAARPLLVFDRGLAGTPWPDQVLGLLHSVFDRVETFAGVEPNPRATTVDRAAESAREQGIDLVIGLGGGSVLDAAKAVAMLIRNEGTCAAFEGKNLFGNRPVPFVAVPTTCGTGSEVTWVSVISDAETKRKISVKGDGMFPAVAVVDSDFISTLPPELIAQTGADALTHATEAYVSRRANPASRALAAHAASVLLDNLEDCVSDPEESGSRERVMEAATIAGMAFGNADVGAVHCLSESIGGLYDHPHGLLNAQLLVPVFRYQFDAVKARLNGFLPGLNAHELLERLTLLIDALKIPAPATLGLPPESFPEIARLAQANNSNESNPLPMSASDYERILADALA